VVPNKYPAVVPDAAVNAGGIQTPPNCDFSSAVSPGIGLHEVVIDTSRHVLSVSELTPVEIADMLAMYRLRLQVLRADSRWVYAQIFKNVGAAAGASLPHSHSQLVAMPFLSPSLLQMLHRAEEYTRKFRRCFWCAHLASEIQSGERIVEETEHFAVLCPFVSRFAGEIEIYPKHHESGFEQVEVSLLGELSELFRRTIIRLEKAVFWMQNPLAYNVVLNTGPFRFDRDVSSLFHWHFSILPSLARAAGFEWGTGLHINPISPEQAAQRLRCV
jgi:UDPglucose--hexose-1-phosphate uridylyltransferase